MGRKLADFGDVTARLPLDHVFLILFTPYLGITACMLRWECASWRVTYAERQKSPSETQGARSTSTSRTTTRTRIGPTSVGRAITRCWLSSAWTTPRCCDAAMLVSSFVLKDLGNALAKRQACRDRGCAPAPNLHYSSARFKKCNTSVGEGIDLSGLEKECHSSRED